jgi:hypothetical protein
MAAVIAYRSLSTHGSEPLSSTLQSIPLSIPEFQTFNNCTISNSELQTFRHCYPYPYVSQRRRKLR